MARRRLLVLFTTAALLAVGAAGAARADAPRATVRVERIAVEPYLADLAKVVAYTNVVSLEGSIVDVKPEELVLQAGNAKLKHVPGMLRFQHSGEPLEVVFVVEVHQSFTVALEDLGEQLAKIVAKLPRATTRVALVTYGETPRATGLLEPPVAAKRVARIAADDVPQPPLLIKALDKAVKILKNARPLRPGTVPRKLIVVISDGNNEDAQDDATMDLFRKVSKNARDAGVVIHSIGYSFTDARLPLRNLGEISKKTGGTFRWARSRADVVGHLEMVNRELLGQMLLTFFVSPDTVEGKSLAVVCKGARCGTEPITSREIKPQPMRCGDATCAAGTHACIADACLAVTMAGASGATLWMVLAVVLLALIAAAVVVVKKRGGDRKKPARKPLTVPGNVPAPQFGGALGQAPGQPQAPQPPMAGYGGPGVVMPDFSKIPYLANSAGVAQLQQQLANIPYVAQHMAAQAGQPYVPAAAQPATRGASILVISGPRQGQTLALRHGFTIGRTPGCDLVIDDGMTSSHHAQFHVDTAGGVSVVDLGSTNGTFVNGVRQMNARLANGMSLRIGQTELRFLQG